MFTQFLNWLASLAPAHVELKEKAERDRKMLHVYAAALGDIHDTTLNVKVPNGTTRKISNIARAAFFAAREEVES